MDRYVRKRAVTKIEGSTLSRTLKMEGKGVVARRRTTPVDPERTFKKTSRMNPSLRQLRRWYGTWG